MAVVAGLPQPVTIPEHIDTMPQDGHRWSLIDLPMISDWERRPLQRVDHAIGKPSQTWWRAVTETEAAALPALPSTASDCSRLWLAPVTGRTHQLRLHMQAVGHPMLGDTLYAPPDVQTLAPRLLLQACEIRFVHPVTQQPLDFRLPADF